MVTSFYHCNDVMERRAAVRFLSFNRAGTCTGMRDKHIITLVT